MRTIKHKMAGATRRILGLPGARRVVSRLGLQVKARPETQGFANIPLEQDIAVYFGDGSDKIYQLTQWIPVLEQLHATRPVLLVFRTSSAFHAASKHTTLPRILVRRFPDLMDVYEDNSFKVVLYVNNSRTNFQSLEYQLPVHIHINHGESDKASMVSNRAKAYDKVFVAGQAAVQRHEAALLDFPLDKLLITGRPQLDIDFPSVVESSASFTVLYAPTWEGENSANNYTSLDMYGVSIVEQLVQRGARVIYKPHPRIERSTDAQVAAAHRQIIDMLEQDTQAGHLVMVQGNILAAFENVDALISDVSSVTLDFLYLHPNKPLILTDRRTDPEKLAKDAPLSRGVPVISAHTDVCELLEVELDGSTRAAQRRELREHYFGVKRGQSTIRFAELIEELIAEREMKIKERMQLVA